MDDRSVELEVVAMNAKFERRLADVESYLSREFGDDNPGNLKHRLAEVEAILEAEQSQLSESENNVSIDPERAGKHPELSSIRMVNRVKGEMEDKLRGLEERLADLSHRLNDSQFPLQSFTNG